MGRTSIPHRKLIMTPRRPSTAPVLAQVRSSTRPGTYLNLALIAFALLGLELAFLIVEPLFPFTVGSIEAAVAHRMLTSVAWVSGSIALVMWARNRTDLNQIGPSRPRASAARWSVIAVLVLITLAGQWVLRGGILPPVAEYAALLDRFGDAGTLAWLVQVAYYIAELGPILLIIRFGQRAGELWLHNLQIPWGGITLAMNWGFVHFLTQDAATGVYGIVLSLVMGTIYILTGRRPIFAAPIIAVLFII